MSVGDRFLNKLHAKMRNKCSALHADLYHIIYVLLFVFFFFFNKFFLQIHTHENVLALKSTNTVH
jgi:hypothetical protein